MYIGNELHAKMKDLRFASRLKLRGYFLYKFNKRMSNDSLQIY